LTVRLARVMAMNRPSSLPNDEATERLLDALVYAPLGFALEAKEMLPKLAERGRGQVALTRLAGTVAAQKGQNEALKAFDELRSTIESLLGCGREEQPSGDAAPAANTDNAAVVSEADLPIAGYDELTAAAIIAMLADLSEHELAVVDAYERANRGRSTVLNRIKQRRS